MGSGREGGVFTSRPLARRFMKVESYHELGSRLSHRPIAGWATTGLSVEWRPAAQLTSPGTSFSLMVLHDVHSVRHNKDI